MPTGSRIAYYYFKGTGPRKPFPILYLHGGPGGCITSRDLAIFSKFANDGYYVFLYDQMGSGKSARLNNIKEYTVERQVNDLEAIIRLIGASKVILIGHSWGASLAPLYLARHPDKVEKLIFSGPGGMIPKNFDHFTPRPDTIILKSVEGIKHHFSDFLDPAGLKRFNKISNYAKLGIKTATDREIDSLLDCLMRNKTILDYKAMNLNDSSFFEGGSGGYSHIRTSMFIQKGKDQRKFLSTLNIPVLILVGESDNIPWACIADYLNVFKNVRLEIIPDSGHAVFSFQPEICLKLAVDFLEQPTKQELNLLYN